VTESDNVNAILTMVAQVPSGRVATYGKIAALAGCPKNSRQVGSVLKGLSSDTSVPWFRIVNSKGEISDRGKPSSQSSRRQRLEAEGVEFDDHGRVSLKQFGWPSH